MRRCRRADKTVVAALSACKVSQPGSVESGVMKEVKKNITIGGKDVFLHISVLERDGNGRI